MPVAVVAGQARGVQTQDQSRLAQTDLADQTLEAVPFSAGCSGFAGAVVNDGTALAWPAERDCATHKVILKFGALLMLAALPRRGLANINIRELRSMCRRDSLSALSGRDQHDLGPRREYAAGSLRSAELADLGLPVTALPAAAEAVYGWLCMF